MNLIVHIPVFIQPYIKKKLPSFYQIDAVPVPIVDLNEKAHSYTKLKVVKQYITLNEEIYFFKQVRNHKNIGYKFYYEELFVVKHKSKYSCESAIYFES